MTNDRHELEGHSPALPAGVAKGIRHRRGSRCCLKTVKETGVGYVGSSLRTQTITVFLVTWGPFWFLNHPQIWHIQLWFIQIAWDWNPRKVKKAATMVERTKIANRINRTRLRLGAHNTKGPPRNDIDWVVSPSFKKQMVDIGQFSEQTEGWLGMTQTMPASSSTAGSVDYRSHIETIATWLILTCTFASIEATCMLCRFTRWESWHVCVRRSHIFSSNLTDK